MSESELAFYKELEQNSKKLAEKVMRKTSGVGNYSSILTLLLRLRQACDHKYLVILGDDKERKVKIENYRAGYDAIKEFTMATKDEIDRIRQDDGFSCQVCDEMLSEDKVLLLGKCGHCICDDCHDGYFDENLVNETQTGKRTAKCPFCDVENVDTCSIELPLYDAVIADGLDWKHIKSRFGLESKINNKAVKHAKIKELITEDGGNIMISAKIEKTIKLVRDIFERFPDEKIIIFSQFTTMFDILQIVFYMEKIRFLRYDGSMNMEEKSRVVEQFKKDPSRKSP
ncbi:unnamed protein product [Ambrosiozyma monospora]|uniref:Unnamed protein product n=1 Tax=Ambrosiozyma monospora TaxID=43982 RepID=A0ACB5U632_AMBMO|nr:unnamed protein product [Ambrosiozyma monospora]